MLTGKGSLNVDRVLDQDADDRAPGRLAAGGDGPHPFDERLLAAPDGHRDDRTDLVRRHRGRDVVATAHRFAVDGNDHVVGLELPRRGRAGDDLVDERAGGAQHDVLAGCAQGNGRRDLLGVLHVLQVDASTLVVPDARRVDGTGRVQVGPLVQAAEELLEDGRLADDHVQEIDAALGRRGSCPF